MGLAPSYCLIFSACSESARAVYSLLLSRKGRPEYLAGAGTTNDGQKPSTWIEGIGLGILDSFEITCDVSMKAKLDLVHTILL